MSNRELAKLLLEQIPEYKLAYAVAYLQGLYADEAQDDDYCRKLIDEYESSGDKGDFVSLSEAAKICGVDLNAV